MKAYREAPESIGALIPAQLFKRVEAFPVYRRLDAELALAVNTIQQPDAAGLFRHGQYEFILGER